MTLTINPILPTSLFLYPTTQLYSSTQLVFLITVILTAKSSTARPTAPTFICSHPLLPATAVLLRQGSPPLSSTVKLIMLPDQSMPDPH